MAMVAPALGGEGPVQVSREGFRAATLFIVTKYDLLREHLDRLPPGRVQLTFSEIDRLVGGLPPLAHRYGAW